MASCWWWLVMGQHRNLLHSTHAQFVLTNFSSCYMNWKALFELYGMTTFNNNYIRPQPSSSPPPARPPRPVATLCSCHLARTLALSFARSLSVWHADVVDLIWGWLSWLNSINEFDFFAFIIFNRDWFLIYFWFYSHVSCVVSFFFLFSSSMSFGRCAII